MTKLRFAVFGTGFWSRFQVPGWLELKGLELVALYNRTFERARELGEKYGIEKIYDDPEALLDGEELDFIDIITDVDTHLRFTTMAAERGLNVVCQKPMAASLSDAKKMIMTCQDHGVKLFINENFRWQAPIRRVKEILDSGVIGEVFKARVTFCSGFPVFDNQPFLKQLDRFILTDIGSHILDVCRFLFGEVKRLYCLQNRMHSEIKGEDVANVLMEMKNGTHCYAEMSYASILEEEVFPQTLILIEGKAGSVQLKPGYRISITTGNGTLREEIKPVLYDWMDPGYAVIHSSIVDTQRDILKGLRGGKAETTGIDNFETVKLVWASYFSGDNNRLVDLDKYNT